MRLLLMLGAAVLLAGCTTYDSPARGAIAYYGGHYGSYGVGGTGARDLDPWLAGTAEGQRLVLVRFDRNYNGEIGSDRAGQANRWFRRFADRNHDYALTDAEISWGLAQIGRVLGVAY